MANEDDSSQMASAGPTPHPGLKALDRLVGTWKVKGQGEGETTYEWMEGGFFLIQRGRLQREDGPFEYMQIIGYENSPGAEPAEFITGRLYSSNGDVLQYTGEADDQRLTIWMGPKGSPAVYRGVWSDDGNTLSGEWEWPGGGYKETMTRMEPRRSMKAA